MSFNLTLLLFVLLSDSKAYGLWNYFSQYRLTDKNDFISRDYIFFHLKSHIVKNFFLMQLLYSDKDNCSFEFIISCCSHYLNWAWVCLSCFVRAIVSHDDATGLKLINLVIKMMKTLIVILIEAMNIFNVVLKSLIKVVNILNIVLKTLTEIADI